MKTKEEILNKCHWDFVNEKGVSSVHTRQFPAAYSEQAQRAMDEYAKQQAIAFLKYSVDRDTGFVAPFCGGKYEPITVGPYVFIPAVINIEEKFSKFIESQNKPS